MPESIASHFNAAEKPGGWSGKGTILLFPFISLVIYIGLTFLSRYPRLYNFPIKITEDNKKLQFYLAQMLVLSIKTEVIWLFGYIEWQTVQTALGKTNGLRASFLFIFLGVLFTTIFLYFVKAFRQKDIIQIGFKLLPHNLSSPYLEEFFTLNCCLNEKVDHLNLLGCHNRFKVKGCDFDL